jgi:hypothetical protein
LIVCTAWGDVPVNDDYLTQPCIVVALVPGSINNAIKKPFIPSIARPSLLAKCT